MQWWCAASNTAWDWSWRAYPGVWVFVALLAFLVLKSQPVRKGWAVAAVAATWVALDWPIGALGAGYLLSFHQVQYVLLVMIAPPLLWIAGGVPRSPRWWKTAAAWLARPVPAIFTCNAVVVITHLPAVVDGLMPAQVGSLVVDLSWLAAGLILWQPVVRPDTTLSYPGRFGYLLVATLIPGLPAAFFFFADYPLYSLYELSPPIQWMPVMQDQFVAGIIMKMGSFLIVLTALTIIFFRWSARDREVPRPITLPQPDAP